MGAADSAPLPSTLGARKIIGHKRTVIRAQTIRMQRIFRPLINKGGRYGH